MDPIQTFVDGRSFITEDIQRELKARFSEVDLFKRLSREEKFIQRSSRKSKFYSRKNFFKRRLIENQLKLAGLYSRAAKNARDVRITKNIVSLRNLPEAFENFKILQISDLHIELSYAACDRLIDLLETVECDICVMTGDYGVEINKALDETLRILSVILSRLNVPVFGVLGNHDTIALVPGMERLGITMLLNEGIVLKQDNHLLFIAGVDDASHFQLHDIEKATSFSNKADVSLILSHSPDIYEVAERAGCQLMLSGHTHGGQICLPGRIPIVLDSLVPRKMGSGSWRHGRLIGYTTTGVGTSVTPARLNCPPEIVIHQLRRANVERRANAV